MVGEGELKDRIISYFGEPVVESGHRIVMNGVGMLAHHVFRTSDEVDGSAFYDALDSLVGKGKIMELIEQGQEQRGRADKYYILRMGHIF